MPAQNDKMLHSIAHVMQQGTYQHCPLQPAQCAGQDIMPMLLIKRRGSVRIQQGMHTRK